jgi:inorganic pyrophosphatase
MTFILLKIHPRGSVVQVKVLGCFALIDEGETDWKVLVIDVTDPMADKLNGEHMYYIKVTSKCLCFIKPVFIFLKMSMILKN